VASAASSVEMTVFVAAVDAGNFSAAARILGITPSAVSKQISRLEARLGARLLNRSTRRISLTDVGREFYERSQSILSDIDAAERAVGDASDRPRGRLRITASISFGQRQIVPLIPEFVSRFPDVRVDVLFSDRMINIVDEGIDVAVRVSAPADSALIARRLVPDRRVICASPTYLREHGMPAEPEDLAAHNALIYSTVYSDTWRFDGPSGSRAVKVSSNFAANSGEAVRDLALRGFGIARLATFLVGPDIKAGRLTAILPDWQDPQENIIHAVYPSRRLVPPSTRAFVDFLAEKMTPGPPWEE
jgi:DNA-binding transcriptional LysR family regulator